MTSQFNARSRASPTFLRQAARTFGGIGWHKSNGKWRHPATGLTR